MCPSTVKGSAEKTSYYGLVKMKDQRKGNGISIFGSFQSKGCQFTSVHVAGDSKLDQTEMKDLSVEGSVELINSTVISKVTIAGFLNAMSSTLGNIEAASTKMVLIGSSAKSIVFKESSPKQEQILELESGSAVTETIEFVSGMGVVIADKSVMLPKTIIGAVVKISK